MSFAELNSVRVRLTLFAATLMALVAVAAFGLFYTQIHQTLARHLDAELVAEWHEFRNIYHDDGIEELQKEFHFEQLVLEDDGGFIRAYDEHGLDMRSGDLSAWGAAADPAVAVASLSDGQPVFDDAIGEHNRIAIRRLHGLIAPDTAVIMGYTAEEHSVVLGEIRRRFMYMILFLIGPVLGGAWLIARQTMRPVESVTRTAVEIAAGKLDRRVEVVGRGREPEALAAAFNTMVEHLLKVTREIKETNDNIAHDLRTPITRVRAASEALLASASASAADETRQVAADIIDECDNLLTIVNTMLDISEMEAGVKKLDLEALDFGELIREACELFAPAVEEHGIRLHASADIAAFVRGDRQLLRRAVCNVLDNSVKFSSPGGDVTIAVLRVGGMVEVTVSDSGCGIGAADLPRVFERFFRGDKARALRGNGLGLGLVKAIASAHKGDVTVSSEGGQGTVVCIRLPAWDGSRHPSSSQLMGTLV